MDTTDKYLAITKYLSDVSIGSICFFDKFLVIVKKKWIRWIQRISI